MKQIILEHKNSEQLGKTLISELQKVNQDHVIIHTSTFSTILTNILKQLFFTTNRNRFNSNLTQRLYEN
jgi:hypothetical protein